MIAKPATDGREAGHATMADGREAGPRKALMVAKPASP